MYYEYHANEQTYTVREWVYVGNVRNAISTLRRMEGVIILCVSVNMSSAMCV